ncbi:MAG: dentilisin complex serine proteinase subunit PrtP [Treponema sp.]
MKKTKLFYFFATCFLLFSCKLGFEGEVGNKNAPSRSLNYRKEAPNHIDLPLLAGGTRRVDVVKGYYIVRTPKDFDKSKFIKMGARICGTMKADAGNIFWYLYKDDEFFIKKVLKLEGVISAEYDFAVYHVNPPKDKLDHLKPKLGKDLTIEDIAKLYPTSLEEGDMKKDPRMNEVNYSLQITHALDAYKELKDDHFKEPVLLGVIDTGFNYCNEDFWFKNKNNKQESISYFVKSAYLLNVGSGYFAYTLSDPIDENDPIVPYAKEFLKSYKNSNRFFEVPCSKVDPGNGREGYDSPDSVMFWNWDNGEHGTHCAGTMAAVGDNDKGVTGVSWKNTKIASYKCFGGVNGSKGWEIYGALDDYASYIEAGLHNKLDQYYPESFETLQRRDGNHTNEADYPYTTEQEKFNYYKDQGVYPINMSLGGPFPTQFASIVMARCLKTGILPVVAMGNDGQRLLEFPVSYDAALAVGATDGRDRRKVFSCSGEWIDVCAPGDGILSTGTSPGHNHPWGTQWLPDGTGEKPWKQADIGAAYTTMSGTSMATPFTTGLLGYLLSFEKARNKNPGWLKAIIQSTADPLEGQAKGVHHEDYGYGRVNVLEAGKAVRDEKDFAGNDKFDYDTTRYVTVKLRNKRSNALDLEGNPLKEDVDLGLSGHPVTVYADDSGDPKGFTFTNNKGEAEFFFLPKRPAGKGYVARVIIEGEYYEKKFEVKNTKEENIVTIEYDSPIIYISTIPPHTSIFDKYSKNGEYDAEVDTVISIYEDGKFDEPIERMDYHTLDIMAFNAKPGKTYFAEITCFPDPYTGKYRTGIYGLRIGYESFDAHRRGTDDHRLDPMVVDKDKRQPVTGRLIHELIHGMDCWEPNDDFDAARGKGDFIDFAKKLPLKSYVVCCLTRQSDGLDRDIFMFKAPDWEEE